ncbi:MULTISPECIES: phage portal protein [Tepidanaerobacter]|uniref:phage portal protein n=1 Tax=Tepidanaerobacter TaxID=499228 RepID=UPI000A4C4978|nr:phage portal protein [Tepidanaerobacter sp. EBM-49]
MLFRNQKKIKNAEITPNWSPDFNELMTFLGIAPDTINVAGKNALKEIVVYTCIKILSDTMSKLPCKIYQDSGGIRKATEHYLYPLLKLRPNLYMSASDFWKCLESQRNIYGNSYDWIDFVPNGRNAGKIQGIYPLDSTKMRIYVDDVGLWSSKNNVWYVYTDNLGNEYKLNASNLLHFKGLTNDGLVGMSPIEVLKLNIENASAAEQFLNNSFKNGMQTAGIVNYIGDLSPQAEENFRKNFERMANGLQNANRISLLPIGYTYQPISVKLTDAQFLENTMLTERQIAAAFGVKLYQINDLEKTSYASTSEANREFYVDTLMAILTMYEQELTYKLFLPQEIMQGYYIKFNPDVILRGDPKSRYEAYAIAIQNGIKTPNEARALEEDPPLEGGDQLLLNGNMIPATKAGQQYQ